MESLDAGVKRNAENNILKIYLIHCLHCTLFGLSSCRCFVWRRVHAKSELKNTELQLRISLETEYIDYFKKIYEQGM